MSNKSTDPSKQVRASEAENPCFKLCRMIAWPEESATDTRAHASASNQPLVMSSFVQMLDGTYPVEMYSQILTIFMKARKCFVMCTRYPDETIPAKLRNWV